MIAIMNNIDNKDKINKQHNIMRYKNRNRKKKNPHVNMEQKQYFDLNIKKKINALSRTIRKKYATLKLHRNLEDAQIERRVLPIVEPIKKLINVKMNIKRELKQEFTKDDDEREEEGEDDVFTSSPAPNSSHYLQRKTVTNVPTRVSRINNINNTINNASVTNETLATNEDDADLMSSRSVYDEHANSQATKEFFDQYHKLPRKYITEMLQSNANIWDSTYGIFYDINSDKWHLGNSNVNIKNHEKDLWIGTQQYEGTEGLYELLFKKSPHDYTQTDLRNYISMLIQTSAHKLKCDPNKRNKGCTSQKYMQIIKPALKTMDLFRQKAHSVPHYSSTFSSSPSKRFGHGLMRNDKKIMMEYAQSNRPVEYVYFDNVNEIVDRLRLLIASRDAGNNSHNNEIYSIVEELKELKIIV